MNGRGVRTLSAFSIAALLAGCATLPRNTVYQLSTQAALEEGLYGARLTCKELTSRGNFGTALPAHLNGRVVIDAGKAYHVDADGKAKPADDALRLTHATVCRFWWDTSFAVNKRTTLKELDTLISQAAPDPRAFCAVRISGRFLDLKLVSSSMPIPPMPAFSRARASARPYMAQDVAGTLIGFRFPPEMKAVHEPGLTFCFLSENLQFGGEVVDLLMQEGQVELDIANQLYLRSDAEADRVGLVPQNP